MTIDSTSPPQSAESRDVLSNILVFGSTIMMNGQSSRGIADKFTYVEMSGLEANDN